MDVSVIGSEIAITSTNISNVGYRVNPNFTDWILKNGKGGLQGPTLIFAETNASHHGHSPHFSIRVTGRA